MSYSDIAACWHKVWLGRRWRAYYIKPAFTYLSVGCLVALLGLWRDIFGGYEVQREDFNSLRVGSPSHLANLMCPHELQTVGAGLGIPKGAILSEASH